MTEAEWLTSSDPRQVMRFLAGKVSTRKLRLFACACCRHVWQWCYDERSRNAVEVAERFADGQATESERAASFAAASLVDQEITADVGSDSDKGLANYAAMQAVNYEEAFGPRDGVLTTSAESSWHYAAEVWVYPTAVPHTLEIYRKAQLARLAPLLRDIVGNPFRLVAFDPNWRTEHTVGIAAKMYDERDFRAMPILADALQEAGCEVAELLAHCREPGTHVRGCWVVDLVLGKS